MRVLVVLSAASMVEGIRTRCARVIQDGDELAVCFLLDPETTYQHSLQIQREATQELRLIFKSAAETVPIFVVTGAPGDGVPDCATAWGAAYVDA
jgi:hypothetical protein